MNVQSINPNNGQVIHTFESAKLADIERSVATAQSAQVNWSRLSIAEREPYFNRLAEVMLANCEQLVRLMQEETGKRASDGETEVFEVIDAIKYYVHHMHQIRPDTSLKLNLEVYPGTDLVIDYVPHGVIGLLMPWNFPFYSPGMFILAALAAGNSVVLKPSEYSTLTGLELQNQFKQAGFPDGLVEVVIGADDVGKMLVKSPVDKIFLVGSVEAGKDVLANAGIKPVQLELGGNSAAIVMEDADLDVAAAGVAWAGTYHAGQDCVGIKRVFVLENVADEFVNKLLPIILDLRPGIDYGPYIRKEALEVVADRIDDAVRKGAQLLCGGERIQPEGGNGFWLTPSVIKYDDSSLDLVRLETFGNTIPIMVVRDLQQAMEMANNTEYGLSNAIFSRAIEKAKALAEQLQSGMVFINDPIVVPPAWDHWTGWKNSGLGTTESKLMQCLKKKLISVNNQGNARAFWYPYPER